MKKLFTLIILLFLAVTFHAQTIVVNNSGNAMYAKNISEVDSITFNSTYSKFNVDNENTSLNIQKTLIDSFTFSNSAVSLDKIYIIYNGTENATVINPYAAQGVSIAVSGGAVTVTAASGISNIEYHLLGSSSSGSLTMSSTTPANFVLNNVNLTNPSGPAIILTGAQTHTFTLQSSTSSTLTDGSSNTKNGTLQSDGKLFLREPEIWDLPVSKNTQWQLPVQLKYKKEPSPFLLLLQTEFIPKDTL